MSKQTKNLGLFQYDPQEDAAQTFNFDVALNENWDKIDDAMETKADLGEDGKIPASQLPDVDVSGAIGAHNEDTGAHPDIRRQVSTNALAAATAQQTAETALREIVKINSIIHVVPTQNGNLTYNGSAQSPAWNSYNPDIMTLGGVTSGTDAGTYTATFTPKDGYSWEDGSSAAKSVTWTITRAIVSVPVQNGILTYNGNAQSPTWNDYDAAKLTIGGTTSGTNAGTYNITFTPTSNCQWNDGTAGANTVAWSIAKAAGSLSLDKTSLSLDILSKTGTISVTRAGDGVITATSSNTAVATVSVSDATVTVTGKESGSATITIHVAAGTNHTAPANKTVNVISNIPSTTLADNTPAQIQAAAKAGQAPNLWSVGDAIGIKINGKFGTLSINDTYYAFIIGFNHNSSIEGNNTIHFQFGRNYRKIDIAFVDGGYVDFDVNDTNEDTSFKMTANGYNSGGWRASYMRNTICPAFLNALPTEWQNIIAYCTKYSDNKGGGTDTASYVTATSDKIWLLAEFEIRGARYYANSAEQNFQKQYDYFKSGNDTIRYKHNSNVINGSTRCIYWTRSVYVSNESYFCIETYVAWSGASRGFAPCFMVA